MVDFGFDPVGRRKVDSPEIWRGAVEGEGDYETCPGFIFTERLIVIDGRLVAFDHRSTTWSRARRYRFDADDAAGFGLDVARLVRVMISPAPKGATESCTVPPCALTTIVSPSVTHSRSRSRKRATDTNFQKTRWLRRRLLMAVLVGFAASFIGGPFPKLIVKRMSTSGAKARNRSKVGAYSICRTHKSINMNI